MKFQSKIVIATVIAFQTFASQTPENTPPPFETIQIHLPNSVHADVIKSTEQNIKDTLEIKKAIDIEREKEETETKLKKFYKKHGYYKQILNNGKEFIFTQAGVIYEKGIRYTYYSSRVLYHRQTKEWILGADGIYRDKDGYIIVASSDHPQGTKVHTPFGKGIVRDSGCASGTIDIYTAF